MFTHYIDDRFCLFWSLAVFFFCYHPVFRKGFEVPCFSIGSMRKSKQYMDLWLKRCTQLFLFLMEL